MSQPNNTENNKKEVDSNSTNNSTTTTSKKYSTKQLTLYLVSNDKEKSADAIKYLKSLPREEYERIKKRLVKNMEVLMKRQKMLHSKSASTGDIQALTEKILPSAFAAAGAASEVHVAPAPQSESLPRRVIKKSGSAVGLSGSGIGRGTSIDSNSSSNSTGGSSTTTPNASGSSKDNVALAIQSASERANLELKGKYKIGDVLGKGGFGTVLKAVSVENGSFVAIKQIDKELVDESQLPSVRKEADLLKRLNHPNIVKIHGIIETPNTLYFVLELVDSGSLASLIKKFGVFPEPLIALYTNQVLKGLQYLHEMGIVHRDIKGDNVLITKEGRAKLADFGTAKLEDTDKTQAVVGTPYWMAPEVIEMSSCGPASDIWSLGCTVIELLTGSPPYFDMGPMTALFNIVEDEHPPLPDNLSRELNDFLLLCFKRDPDQRPTAKALLDHTFIKSNVKTIETPIDLEAATGTLRQHNQSKTIKRSVMDMWGPEPTRGEPEKESKSKDKKKEAGGDDDKSKKHRKRTASVQASSSTSTGMGTLKGQQSAKTKYNAEKTKAAAAEDEKSKTTKKLDAIQKERARVDKQLEELKTKLDVAMKEREALTKEKQVVEKQLDKTLSEVNTLTKQNEGVEYLLNRLQQPDVKQAAQSIKTIQKLIGKDVYKKLASSISRGRTKERKKDLTERRARSCDPNPWY